MSWAVTTYHCRACNAEFGDTHTWGLREYLMPNGVRIPMSWTLGWCPDCNNVAPVELLDEARCQDELSHAEADLHSFGPRPDSMADEQAIANWNHLAGVAEDAKDALRVISERKKPLHCLICGCERITPWQLRTDEAMNRIHGVCGGQLEASQDEFRVALKLIGLRYNLDGDLVAEEDIEGYSVPDPAHHELRDAANARIRGLASSTEPTVSGSVRPWFRFS